jgi:hypothetical protein
MSAGQVPSQMRYLSISKLFLLGHCFKIPNLRLDRSQSSSVPYFQHTSWRYLTRKIQMVQFTLYFQLEYLSTQVEWRFILLKPEKHFLKFFNSRKRIKSLSYFPHRIHIALKNMPANAPSKHARHIEENMRHSDTDGGSSAKVGWILSLMASRSDATRFNLPSKAD